MIIHIVITAGIPMFYSNDHREAELVAESFAYGHDPFAYRQGSAFYYKEALGGDTAIVFVFSHDAHDILNQYFVFPEEEQGYE